MPDLPFAQRLAHELNVPDAFLYASDDVLAELIVCFGKLPLAKRKALLAHAQALAE